MTLIHIRPKCPKMLKNHRVGFWDNFGKFLTDKYSWLMLLLFFMLIADDVCYSESCGFGCYGSH